MIKRRARLQWKSCFPAYCNSVSYIRFLLIQNITLPKRTSVKPAGSLANINVEIKIGGASRMHSSVGRLTVQEKKTRTSFKWRLFVSVTLCN